eukprot:8378114-Pyramimonas_sp.AAC.1
MRPPGQARRAWRIHRCGVDDEPGQGAVDMYRFRRPNVFPCPSRQRASSTDVLVPRLRAGCVEIG